MNGKKHVEYINSICISTVKLNCSYWLHHCGINSCFLPLREKWFRWTRILFQRSSEHGVSCSCSVPHCHRHCGGGSAHEDPHTFLVLCCGNRRWLNFDRLSAGQVVRHPSRYHLYLWHCMFILFWVSLFPKIVYWLLKFAWDVFRC